MGYKVLEVQSTPNPNAAKFILDKPVSAQPTSFFNASAAAGHAVAAKLFEIPGVSSVLLLGDFITINKSADATWPAVRKKVEQTLAALS